MVTDAWNGYHSIPFHKSDRHLITFITLFGQWYYMRAPQGFLSSRDGYNLQATIAALMLSWQSLSARSAASMTRFTKTATLSSTSGGQSISSPSLVTEVLF